jgi:hypothetical protein
MVDDEMKALSIRKSEDEGNKVRIRKYHSNP